VAAFRRLVKNSNKDAKKEGYICNYQQWVLLYEKTWRNRSGEPMMGGIWPASEVCIRPVPRELVTQTVLMTQ
jgi:hypothetical protein